MLNQYPELKQWSAAGRRIVHEADTKRLLSRAGIPIPAEAPRSGQCVVKVASDRFPHKTDHGLVILRVPPDQVKSEATRLKGRVPEGEILVEEMIEDGVAEWMIGCRHDSVFGPIVVSGPGGVLVELLDTACIRLAPLDLNEARQAVMRYPQAAKLLRGMRGRPGGDVDALVQLLHRLSHFFVAHSSLIEEIEINPVIVRPEGRGVVVVDALMTLR